MTGTIYGNSRKGLKIISMLQIKAKEEGTK
jgi:hypothetical protein